MGDPTFGVRSHASQPTTVDVGDMSIRVPGAGTSVALPGADEQEAAYGSRDLRRLCTDDAHGAGQSTLILYDSAGDVAQSQVDQYLDSLVGNTPPPRSAVQLLVSMDGERSWRSASPVLSSRGWLFDNSGEFLIDVPS